MTSIYSKLNALLLSEDYTLLESRQYAGGKGLPVYNLSYMNCRHERVYLFIHEAESENKTEGSK